jgi:hypothetical protein
MRLMMTSGALDDTISALLAIALLAPTIFAIVVGLKLASRLSRWLIKRLHLG